jgi:hypothetical protein
MRRTATSRCVVAALAAALLSPFPDLPATAATRPRPLVSTPAGEFQPARGRLHLAWERNTAAAPRRYDVFARRRGRRRFRVNAPGTNAANGGISGMLLVYQQWRGRRSDIRVYNLRKHRRRRPAKGVNTAHWEYWPSVSGRWLLFGRRKPGGARRIVLFDRRTGRARTLARTRGRSSFAAPGQVSGRWAVWWKCTPSTGCNVFRYNIRRKTRLRVPNPGRYQRAPSVTPQGTVYFVRAARRCGASVKLMRYFPGAPPKALRKLTSGTTINDTYAYSGRVGRTKLLFERSRCGRPAASDIWRLEDPRFYGLEVVRRAAGGGTVTTSPRGISCGGDCLQSFRGGSSVTLTATPEADSNFTGWGGACSGQARTCTLEMKHARRVVVFFDPASSFTLSVSRRGDGNGKVTSRPQGIHCGRDCWHSYRAGTLVRLTASASAGSRFVRWRGACRGTGRCRVNVDRVRTVVAVFRRRAQTSYETLPCCLAGRGASP